MNRPKYYLTTSITYASRVPHIGNTYEAVLTDCLARHKRAQGFDVYYLTGTDEHGQKIEEQAKKDGLTPQAHVDKIAGELRRIWDFMDVSYDGFIRTTDPAHEKIVQKIFKKLYEQGDIYKSAYEGLYCVACEAFYTETQAEGHRCPDCGAEVSPAREEAYFLKLSRYADRLMRHIEAHPDFILPESRRNEMINNFLKPGLQDLCVSRTSFSWGVPVDFDPGHVVYVWIDALSNYITALGYDPDGVSGPLYQKYWPADVHVIGKDIVRFHAIYWPIILMALDIPLPTTILGHPWLLSGDDKMSKSKGNVVYARDLVDEFGVDAVRYYLLREMPYNADGTLTRDQFVARVNSDLANDLGNLLSRTTAMCEKYFAGALSDAVEAAPLDAEVLALIEQTEARYHAALDAFQTANALAEAWKLVARANKYIDETMPWALAKDEANRPRLAAVLKTLVTVLRALVPLIEPAMPRAASKMRAQIEGEVILKGENLFPRIEAEAKAAPVVEKTPAIPEITIDDFARLDLRVARVLSCEPVAGSDKLLCLQVDAGEPRQVVSGIARFYKPEALVGRSVILVKNLKSVKLRGVMSQGMILCAENNDDEVSVLFAPEGMKPGAKVR